MPSERAPGFYWVKWTAEDKWEPARWAWGSFLEWDLFGSSGILDSDLFQIGERCVFEPTVEQAKAALANAILRDLLSKALEPLRAELEELIQQADPASERIPDHE